MFKMKYYAVVVGKTPGIYTDWPTAQSMVKGYPGALYKSFTSKSDAEDFMKKSISSKLIDSSTPVAYTDGSYIDSAGGFGVIILLSDGTKYTAYGRVPLPATNNVAELYAIYVALSLIRDNINIYTDSQYSIGCLTTYIHSWMKDGWPSSVANKELIKTIYKLMEGRKVNFQHVKAHCGISLNEEADQLANKGRIITENLIILKDDKYYP